MIEDKHDKYKKLIVIIAMTLQSGKIHNMNKIMNIKS